MRKIVNFLLLISICCAIISCERDLSVQNGPGEAQELAAFQLRIGDYLKNIHQAYVDEDYTRHISLTGELIDLMSANTLETLTAIDRPMLQYVARGEISPFYSILIEYSYRLTRYPTEKSHERYQLLKEAFFDHAASESQFKPEFTALIRSIDTVYKFVPYSYRAGAVVTSLSMSDIGRMQYFYGSAPETFLRMAQFLLSCEEIDEILNGNLPPADSLDPKDGLKAQENCQAYRKELIRLLSQDGSLPNPGEFLQNQVTDPINGGISKGMDDCLRSRDTERQNMIEKIDWAKSCSEEFWTPAEGPATDRYGNLIASDQTGGDAPYYVKELRKRARDHLREQGYRPKLNDPVENQFLHSPDGLVTGSIHTTNWFHQSDPTQTATIAREGGFDDSGIYLELTITQENYPYTSPDGTILRGTHSVTFYEDGIIREAWSGQDGAGWSNEYDQDYNLIRRVEHDGEGNYTIKKYHNGEVVGEIRLDKDLNCQGDCDTWDIDHSSIIEEAELEDEILTPFDAKCDPQKNWGIEPPKGNSPPIKPRITIDANPVDEPCLFEFVEGNAERLNPLCRYISLCISHADPSVNCGCTSRPETPRQVPCRAMDCTTGVCDPNSHGCKFTGYPPFPGILDFGRLDFDFGRDAGSPGPNLAQWSLDLREFFEQIGDVRP